MTDTAVIGLDTSCYTTSAAAVTTEGHVIASCRRLLPVREGERGLRQSDAVFLHIRQLPALVEELTGKLEGRKIAAICASASPRDGDASYMPVFQVGEGAARMLAATLGVPFFSTTHQRGHIAAAGLDSGMPEGDFLALHLSGGTTEMLSVRRDSLTLLGGTRDLHAGQLVDRCGVALGLPFPAGPHLEELAVQGVSHARLPVSMEQGGLFCHLSGAESQVQRWIAMGELPQADLAREVYDLLARTVARLITAGAETAGVRQALLAGGVASSSLFRSLVTERVAKQHPGLRLYFGRPEFSGDNAVGVALIGAQKWKADHSN